MSWLKDEGHAATTSITPACMGLQKLLTQVSACHPVACTLCKQRSQTTQLFEPCVPLQDRFQAHHLSRDNFDNEICRRFMGLSEAAVLEVLANIPRRGVMVSRGCPFGDSLRTTRPLLKLTISSNYKNNCPKLVRHDLRT